METLKRCWAGWVAAVRQKPLRLLWLVAFVPLAVAAILAIYIAVLVPLTPSIADIRTAREQKPSVLVSADGQVLATFRSVNRKWVKLDDVSPAVIDALIATEDQRFYDHNGLDVRRTISAAVHCLFGDLQGGSTISQQLARNMFPDEIGRAPTIERKAKEAITALKIEHLYSKNDILEMYLNTVPFLYNAYGIEVAAHTYFDKSARDLDTIEAATLIGMLKGTRYYNPVINPERAVQRRNIVLAQLVKHDKLDAAQFEQLKAMPLGLDFERQEQDAGNAPHVAQQLKSWLIAWADAHGYNIYADGLVVHTTIDSRLQSIAVDALTREADKLQTLSDQTWSPRARAKRLPPELARNQPRIESAFYAQDPITGHVLAWVGSRDFKLDQFDHVQQAKRQPGSTFKPFVYGAAFDMGIAASETFLDAPPEITIDANTTWRPGDVHDATYQPTTLRDGLVYSKNSITVQLAQRVGTHRIAQLAQAMGVRQSSLDEVPSLALGTSPVTLKEMVSAYSTIADGGDYIEPILVLGIENRAGEVLEQFAPPPSQAALSLHATQTLLDVMRGVVDRGTGAAIRSRYNIAGDLAGKTGTTQNNTDGWFILMHPQLVAGAWVGFNDARITMGDAWGQGARNALLVVGDFFQQVQKAKLVDAKATFNAPHETSTPDPDANANVDADAQVQVQVQLEKPMQVGDQNPQLVVVTLPPQVRPQQQPQSQTQQAPPVVMMPEQPEQTVRVLEPVSQPMQSQH